MSAASISSVSESPAIKLSKSCSVLSFLPFGFETSFLALVGFPSISAIASLISEIFSY